MSERDGRIDYCICDPYTPKHMRPVSVHRDCAWHGRLHPDAIEQANTLAKHQKRAAALVSAIEAEIARLRAPVDPPVCLCDPVATRAAIDCPRHGDPLYDPPERVSEASALREAADEAWFILRTVANLLNMGAAEAAKDAANGAVRADLRRRALEDTKGEG